ncbi:low temperature requirement protein A [Pseudomonas sp. CCI3.2]|uniref:low temperature requirement protein A n=1 Tax=unclassified Pseudomonas TaxID=196821 RepID=UPI002AC9A95C|nr:MULTISPECIES: low temperature requirement protein A [unclassified Pseudomonas]MEB0075808.1 low temperature requirement protein A [Pseudomonas sp. MH10out]MEB0102794.1 low temperature requirement protein A [Pseudomonas sp. CCI3.2]MEB0131562.1 low temperature requirement protein A [Pseudomonas sp. CCI2.4]MEB0156455.1 low temperature requirement protein A [Pseudomonas sp. AH2 (2023)]MEB0167220.1 low temperature requirement protein A [Pseudomonas sp. CCC4.4]
MSPSSLLRSRGSHDSGKVGMIELFFDLVFVFAVTQLSHSLLANLTVQGALQVTMLLLAVWWVWIFTSWITNWLDPERIPVRLALFALMLAGLLLSVSIPNAFTDRGPMFAFAYVAMQVGRTSFAIWAVRHEPLNMTRNFQRILVWLLCAGVFWTGGGLLDDGLRIGLWGVALVIELISPSVYFWVPGLGRSSLDDWNIEGNHMAERCALFVIIALGESLLVTGATFGQLELTLSTVIAFLVAVLGSVAMWWVYFDSGAERAHHRIANSEDPGREARVAYTYLHALIIAGIIASAVADELVLMHTDHATGPGISAILAGPALYLLGTALFKMVTASRIILPLSHLIGLLLLVVLAPFAFAQWLSALALGSLTTGILLIVATWESVALRKVAQENTTHALGQELPK